MKKQDISAKIKDINNAILAGRLAIAFSILRNFSEQLMTWEITDEVNRLEESYKYMLHYAMKGVNDPQRQSLYADLENRMKALADRLDRHASITDTPTLYFNTIRYHNRADRRSIATRLREFKDHLRDNGLYILSSNESDVFKHQEKTERLEQEIFNLVWVTHPIVAQDYDALTEVLSTEIYPRSFKQLMVSALLLGIQEYYDANRLKLLCLAYEKGDEIIAPVALIALLLALYTYKSHNLESSVRDRIALLTDLPTWHSDLRDAFLEIVRARDTERITRTMQDELVSEMMKLNPEISERFRDMDSAAEFMNPDVNPEWQEVLEKSGIADKMKKLLEIQMEGGDVFMSTFSHLKMFPFFSDIAHWFVPYSSDRTIIRSMDETLRDLGRLLDNTPVFCNSDKYSFILSLTSVPEAQRSMIRSQFDAQVDAVLEMERSSLTTGRTSRRRVMNHYVQDLYRFFRLFRRKAEFHDPFIEDLNLVDIPVLSNQFKDVESLQTIAEFYFKHQYYKDALSIFKAIENISYPDASLFEKIGYCYERQGNYREALKYYEQAELLNADSIWTLRHIAMCHRFLHNPTVALKYYNRILEKETTENLATVMAIGNCYLETGDYAKATQYFYKVQYLDNKHKKASRQLAWCLLMQKEFDKSKAIYDEIINDNPTPQDYLNMGHLALVTGDDVNALNFYKLCKARADGTLETFNRMLNGDAEAFITLGLDPNIFPLIIDAITYSER